MIKPGDFIVVKLSLFLVMGILFGRALEIQPLASGILAGTGLCILGIAAFNNLKTRYLFGASALFVALSTGMLLYSLAFGPNRPGHYSQFDIESNHLWQLKILEMGNSSDYSQAYVARVIALDQQAVHGKIRLRIRHASDSSKNTLGIDDDIRTLSFRWHQIIIQNHSSGALQGPKQ